MNIKKSKNQKSKKNLEKPKLPKVKLMEWLYRKGERNDRNLVMKVTYPINTFPINMLCQCTLLTHPSNPLSQPTLLTHFTNPPSRAGQWREHDLLSTHPINTPFQSYQHTLTTPSQPTLTTPSQHPLNPPSQHPLNTLSAHPTNPPYQLTLLTNPINVL